MCVDAFKRCHRVRDRAKETRSKRLVAAQDELFHEPAKNSDYVVNLSHLWEDN